MSDDIVEQGLSEVSWLEEWRRVAQRLLGEGSSAETARVLEDAAQRYIAEVLPRLPSPEPRPPENLQAFVTRLHEWMIEEGLLREALLLWEVCLHKVELRTSSRLFNQMRNEGWETRRLQGSEPDLFVEFHRPLSIRVWWAREECFVTDVPELAIHVQGPGPSQSIDAAVREIRAQALAWHQRMSHTLTLEERRRKGALLSRVDLVRSGLFRPRRANIWIYGRIERPPGETPLFHVLGTREAFLELSQEVMDALSARGGGEDELCLARVGTGLTGEPVGPVRALREPGEP